MSTIATADAADRIKDEAAVRALLEDWMEALRAKDAARVIACHSADYVQFSLAPPLVYYEGDAAGLQAWFDSWDDPLGYDLQELRIHVGEDTAFCHGLARLHGNKRGESEIELWFRLTLGLRKTGGGAWRIAHEHESVPFYMDGSYRAAVDLTPQSDQSTKEQGTG